MTVRSWSASSWTMSPSLISKLYCLATGLVEVGGFNASDQMRRYRAWYEQGYLSGNPFAGLPDPQAAGNGCVMRLAPVPMFFHPNVAEAVRWVGESARTTHGAAECIEACELLASMICAACRYSRRTASRSLS